MVTHASVSRVWAMTRLRAGDYLLPSNDRRTLWRISRYREDGSLERGDGSKVVGWFWRAARYRHPVDQVAPDVYGAASLGRTSDAVERFLDWDAWTETACLLKTREEAIAAALEADPPTHEYVVESNGLLWVAKCDCGWRRRSATEAGAERAVRAHADAA